MNQTAAQAIYAWASFYPFFLALAEADPGFIRETQSIANEWDKSVQESRRKAFNAYYFNKQF